MFGCKCIFNALAILTKLKLNNLSIMLRSVNVELIRAQISLTSLGFLLIIACGGGPVIVDLLTCEIDVLLIVDEIKPAQVSKPQISLSMLNP